MWQAWCEANPDLEGGGRLLSLQLGGGCSISAIQNGRPLDNSMGFSPLEGLMMASRSGDIDPGAVIYLAREKGMALDDIEAMLNEQSGLKGVSEQGSNMQELVQSEDSRARLAIDMYCYRIRKYIGAFTAVLGGLDGIVFGGGVGENAPPIRAQVLNALDWLGVRLDATRNERLRGQQGAISASGSQVRVWVVPVNEAEVMVQEALELARRDTRLAAHRA